MSVTKLGEYVTAGPGRRRTIVRDQKHPPAFKAAKFREAYPAISAILVGGCAVDAIDKQIAVWRKRTPSTKFQVECVELCIDALTAFKALVTEGKFQGLSFVVAPPDAYVEIGGVEVSIRPEVLISGPEIGAVKIYLGKTTPLVKDVKGRPGSASYVATALHLWAEDTFGSAPADRCLVVDVFAKEVYAAPMRNITRRSDLTAACEEIASVWSAIKAPAAAAPTSP
jgi:hypothetical protein